MPEGGGFKLALLVVWIIFAVLGAAVGINAWFDGNRGDGLMFTLGGILVPLGVWVYFAAGEIIERGYSSWSAWDWVQVAYLALITVLFYALAISICRQKGLREAPVLAIPLVSTARLLKIRR
ncbi:MAG: hypothetical protein HYV07_25195 [Deltaproteobacteria bacterium]|nr:hypothetical protein [Deltaproteobacteria bacterium]